MYSVKWSKHLLWLLLGQQCSSWSLCQFARCKRSIAALSDTQEHKRVTVLTPSNLETFLKISFYDKIIINKNFQTKWFFLNDYLLNLLFNIRGIKMDSSSFLLILSLHPSLFPSNHHTSHSSTTTALPPPPSIPQLITPTKQGLKVDTLETKLYNIFIQLMPMKRCYKFLISLEMGGASKH